jgi:hypothetical protein
MLICPVLGIDQEYRHKAIIVQRLLGQIIKFQQVALDAFGSLIVQFIDQILLSILNAG